MGAWRAFMSRARGRTRNPFLSNKSLSKFEQRKPCPLAPAAPPSESQDEIIRLNERIWPGSGLGFLSASQKEPRKDAEALLEDAKEFLLSVKKDFERLDLGSSEHCCQVFDQSKSWLHAGALWQEQRTLALNAEASLDITKVILQGTSSDYLFSTCDAAIKAPGFHGSEDFSIQADSVKRKRKKKMNKHKHRKLRRLARRSHK